MPADRVPLRYTFANHMHWVDMEWLWSERVLEGSTRDMLRLCAEADLRGNVNFDGVGYERMAAECPAALAELRAALAAGTIEVVGGSWGQPYGQFQGGESNVRQLTLGVRACLRHLGQRPRAFWEEEFWFFPQLPQLLAGCGHRGACLFFQWTWHTPELPLEEHALVRWRGLDGTTLPTLPRNGLNLHQWPEDFEPILASPLLEALEKPALVQWVELLPSPDWMCRSELLLPRTLELRADPRFELLPRTLSELIEELDDERAPVRTYGMDDAWHGLSLGKNADAVPRASLAVERQLLAAEGFAALAGLCGRPYPSWDVHPDWELAEAWRELCAAQHHDNHECEGLCGFIGHDGFDKAGRMARRVRDRSLRALARRLDPAGGAHVVGNALGWERDVLLEDGRVAPGVPAFGYRQFAREELLEPERGARTGGAGGELRLERGASALLAAGPTLGLDVEGCEPMRLGLRLAGTRDGARRDLLAGLEPSPAGEASARYATTTDEGDELELTLRWHPVQRALELHLCADHGRPWDPGMNAALALDLVPAGGLRSLAHDHPFALTRVEARASRSRKYPTGDWMTSEQWFEEVAGPFSALHLVDAQLTGGALLVVHDGSQSWQRTDAGLRVLLNVVDPWDEEYWQPQLEARLWLVPHDGLDATARLRIAQELLAEPCELTLPAGEGTSACVGGGALDHQAPPLARAMSGAVLRGRALPSAWRRCSASEGEHLPEWAGHGMAAPHELRLVELEGEASSVELFLPGPLGELWRTNLLGEREERLEAREAGPDELSSLPAPPAGAAWQRVALELCPHGVVTLLADCLPGRKEPRDLDARRKVWAAVHHRTPPRP